MARFTANRFFQALLVCVALVALLVLYWTALSGDEPPRATRGPIPETVLQPTAPPLEPEHFELVRRAIGSDGLLALHLERYRREVGRYPERLEELVQSEDEAAGGATWGGPYLRNADLLRDPWGQPYRYRSPGERHPRGYDLWSVGPTAGMPPATKSAIGDALACGGESSQGTETSST